MDPLGTARERRFTATCCPKVLVTSSISTMFIGYLRSGIIADSSFHDSTFRRNNAVHRQMAVHDRKLLFGLQARDPDGYLTSGPQLELSPTKQFGQSSGFEQICECYIPEASFDIGEKELAVVEPCRIVPIAYDVKNLAGAGGFLFVQRALELLIRDQKGERVLGIVGSDVA